MFCPHCGNKVDDEANFCFYCGYEIKDKKRSGCKIKEEKRKRTSGLIVASIVFIVLSICSFSILGFLFLFVGIVDPTIGVVGGIVVFLICALIVTIGIISIKTLNSAKHKREVIISAISTLLFCNLLAGIFMLCTSEKDYCE